MLDRQTDLRQRKKELTRQAITDAAMRLFLEHGFDQVSIIQIAAAAEVSVQTLYNYFPAKADLVFDEADQIADDLVRVVRHRAPGQSALSAIRGYVPASHPGWVTGGRMSHHPSSAAWSTTAPRCALTSGSCSPASSRRWPQCWPSGPGRPPTR